MQVEIPEWVGDVARILDEEYDAGTMGRGRGYAENGHVTQLGVTADGGRLIGSVKGSGRVYQSIIDADGDARAGYAWATSCTCPLGGDCKHVVATLLVAASHLTPPEHKWGQWEQLFASLATSMPGAARDTGYGLWLTWPSKAHLPQEYEDVQVNPVQRNKAGKWVKANLSWSNITYSYSIPAPVREAYSAFAAAAEAQRRMSRYYVSNSRIELGDLGGRAVPLLQEAERAGVAIIANDKSSRVAIISDPAKAQIDVRRTADGEVVVDGTWRNADQVWRPRECVIVGSPPNALVGRRGTSLQVVAVTAPTTAVGELLNAGTITVPARDAEKFLSVYYPLLCRQSDVGSSDNSVAPPVETPPRLAVAVKFEPQHRVSLEWAFTYGTEPGAIRFPLAEGAPPSAGQLPSLPRSPYGLPGRPTPSQPQLPTATDPAASLRRPEDEKALLTAVTSILEPHVPGIIWRYGPLATPQPYLRSTLVGMQAATFATQVLGQLQTHPDIDVTVTGDMPDYREITEAPTVRLAISDAGENGDDNDWFDLGVTVEVGGESVPFAPLFTALASGEEHMLLPSGAWFSLKRPELDQLRTLIAEARALTDREGPLRLSRWQAGLWDELTDIGVVESQSSAWSAQVDGMLDPSVMADVAAPDALQATLRDYQLQGYRWLRYLWEQRLGGILADDMGLGKTVQAIAAILSQRTPDQPPVLVLAPTSVIGTWVEEAVKFAPDLRVVPVREMQARRGTTLEEVRDSADVVVTSYGLARLEADDYHRHEWAAVLLDEAQFIKNPRARTHHVVRDLRAPVKIAMTGTPLENSLMDLWALLAVTAPGLFPRPEMFSEVYRKPIESGADPEALTRLQRRLRPLMLRRTKELVAPELPPKQEQVMRIDLAPAHRRLYDKHLQRERARVLGMLDDFDKNRIAIFRSLMVLRRLALAPSLVDPDGPGAKVTATKVDAFAEQIAEIAAEGHRALVFSQFTGFLSLVRDRLNAEGIGHVYLDGRTRDRARRVETWRAGDDPVFLISLKAGGFGLTLTEADYVFVLDPWWNPAAEAQAVDRTHRIGQDKTVMVYRLIATDTIEEKVLALQQRKRDLFTRVVDDGGSIDGALTADDIRGLLER